MEMEVIPASDANLCQTCLGFAAAVSRRSDVFLFDTFSETTEECESSTSSLEASSDTTSDDASESSGKLLSAYSSDDKREGLWPASPGCRLCQMIADHHRCYDTFWPSANITETRLCFWNYPEELGDGSDARMLPHRLSHLGIDPLIDGDYRYDLRRDFSVWTCHDNPVAIAREVTSVPELSSDCCPEAFSLIRSWISLCLDRHPECRHTISGAFVDDINGGPPLPTRVLDVGDVRNNHVRILESRGRRGTFCALSYCWGTGEHNVKTTKDNYDQHLKSIKWGSMPQTFKDAIEITRETGVRYLWIDSLCIIQDDKSDWAAESSRMSAVYETAYLVIAASGAFDPSQGCFSSDQRCPVAVEIPYELSSGTVGATVCISLRNPYEERPQFGPLNQRGWALQETHLARRTVYYMPGGMCWKCKMLRCTERSNEDFGYYDDWDSILQQYSDQNLTIRTDRLPALQGLANAYQERSQDRYCIGIFGSDLPAHLLWMMQYEQTEETFNWPTWSWASKEGSKTLMSAQVGMTANISCPKLCFDEESSALHIIGPIASAKIGGTLTLDKQDAQINPALAAVLSWLHFTRRLPCQSIQSQQDMPEIIGVAAMDGSYSGAVSIALLSETSWNELKSSPMAYYTTELQSFIPSDVNLSSSDYFHWAMILVPTGLEGHYFRIGIGAILRDPGDISVQAADVEYIID